MELLNHPIYKRVSKEEADACAWVFLSPKIFSKYYYKNPKLKEKEVRIRITYTGICRGDIIFKNQVYGKVNFPFCPGHELVGEIIKIGEKAIKYKIGDKVMVGPFRNACFKCYYCKIGKTNYCTTINSHDRFLYGEHFGGYSTHIQLNEHHVFKLPENLEEKSICPIMCAGMTTFLPLFKYGKKDFKIAVIGCGGLGHFGIQFGNKMGMRVDLLTSCLKKSNLAKKLGAKDIYNWKKNEHLKKKDFYDLILNTISCPLTENELTGFLEILKPEGKFIQVGISDVDKNLIIKPEKLVFKGLQIIGSMVGGIKDYENMFNFVKNNKIICLSEIYDWEDFPKAVDKLVNGKPFFRCVVNVDDFSKYIGK